MCLLQELTLTPYLSYQETSGRLTNTFIRRNGHEEKRTKTHKQTYYTTHKKYAEDKINTMD